MKKRIGFIAMSGVRVQNAELLAVGLTLPGFVERSEVIASLPSLSLLTLAALTPDRFDVTYLEILDLKTAGRLPEEFDLVAITSLTAQINEAYAVADFYRSIGVPVVMGGLHVTAMRDEALARWKKLPSRAPDTNPSRIQTQAITRFGVATAFCIADRMSALCQSNRETEVNDL